MGRSFYILVIILLSLVFPIVWENVRHEQLLGYVPSLILMIFGLGLSGPLLILYSLLVHLFADVKEKKALSILALSIGLPWTLFMMFSIANGVD